MLLEFCIEYFWIMADYGLMKPHSQKAELQIRSNHCVHSLHVPQPKMEGGTSYSVVPSMGHQHHQLGVPWALLHPLGLPLKAAVFMLTHTSASPSAASWFFPGGMLGRWRRNRECSRCSQSSEEGPHSWLCFGVPANVPAPVVSPGLCSGSFLDVLPVLAGLLYLAFEIVPVLPSLCFHLPGPLTEVPRPGWPLSLGRCR